MAKSRKLRMLEMILRFMSSSILRKYKPKVIAITGSVGKTTTKEMVWELLSNYYRTRKNEKNYNNEIGVPLTIIGSESGESSIFGWLAVFFKWLFVIVFPVKYPEILVLEMGADRPGDIKYLCSFVPIDVGVITNIGISHLEYFKTKKALGKEKGIILKSVPAQGLAIMNYDDKEVKAIREQVKANVISYGLEEGCQMQATDITYSYKTFMTNHKEKIELVKGVQFKLNYRGKIIPVKLGHALGYPQVYASLIALSVGEYFKLNLIEVVQTFEDFCPPKGRMVLLDGIKHTAIVDDTYNSAPDSVDASLETLKNIKVNRKIVVLGDMLELGDEEERGHRQVGEAVASAEVDYFVSVGQRTKHSADEFRKKARNNGAVTEFNTPMEAGIFIQHLLEEGDVVLVKGSQGMRMEKVVEEIMAKPSLKHKLLVRQDKTWLEKEFIQP
ncbi:MAG: UDP-N-acetylmuramoyl-tripeptide--D-alanyl-D-alanine ligase [Patescibacteria group bacterium]|nr:UDP-N-acetylmuramoyl-tripeptide--D-alanyl-D-alanine ligase [Patescibacteria group bacterium]